MQRDRVGGEIDVLLDVGIDHDDLQVLADELRELATMASQVAKNVSAAQSRLDDGGLPMSMIQAAQGLIHIRCAIHRAREMLKLATSGQLERVLRHRRRALAAAKKRRDAKPKS